MLRLNCILTVAAYCLVVQVPLLQADDSTPPELKPMLAAVKKLVTAHYPKAEVALADGTIHFEYNARKFMVHEQSLLGVWQDAFEELGPNKGGIVGDLKYEPGRYMGMAAVPQIFDKRYYLHLLTAPNSKKLDAHLWTVLKYPRNAPADFVKDFEQLVNEWEKHVAP
jgi:hypothetical protein